MEKVVIVTGGSKGIGNGIIEAYLKEDFRVFSIARTKNPAQTEAVHHLQSDLSDYKHAEIVFTTISQLLDGKNIKRIVLINNAATLGVVDSIDRIPAADIQKTISLNLTSPFILTAAFIRLTQQWPCVKKIINISSGAAYKPIYGWAVYSATKAAIDMLTKSVAVEQSHQQYGVKVVAIHPGVIDTDMQATIRNVDESKFKDVKRFIGLKNEGKLADPKVVGAKIYEVDVDDAIENGAIIKF